MQKNNLKERTVYMTVGIITAAVIMAITLVAAWLTKETFGKDLKYVEV